MKKWTVTIFLIILLLVGICYSLYINHHYNNKIKEVKVVCDDNYPPYAFRDEAGNLKGIIVDEWNLWSVKTGIKVDLVGTSWNKALKGMQEGKYDVIDTFFYNEERDKIYDFSAADADIDVSIFFSKEISGITDLNSIKGFQIGVKKDDNSVNILEKSGIDSYIEFNDYEDIINAFKNNKISVFIMDNPPALYFLYKYHLQNEAKHTDPLYTGQFHRAVKEGNSYLLRIINSGFSKVSYSDHSSINNKWFGFQYSKPNYDGYIIIFILVFLIISGFLIAWNIILKKMVKSKTSEIYQLSIRDPITGLYNRFYFEDECDKITKNTPSGCAIIFCDLDGLKFINDTLGHPKGDECIRTFGNLLTQCFKNEDIVIARIGGDEFGLLLKNTTESDVLDAKNKIELAIEKNNPCSAIPLSVSIGYSFSNEELPDLKKLFIDADNAMYQDKLHHKQSTHSEIIDILQKVLEARDSLTEGHSDRIHNLAVAMCKALNFSSKQIQDMSLLSQFHDIGKIGIRDSILLKPDKLTQDEFEEMKQHSEIGYKISSLSSYVSHLSEWILKHHEWWDGNGYPLGISGNEIPIQCRILSILDAYDAMTNDRPYRNALSQAEAIAELISFSGKQFDPYLVEQFIGILHKDVSKAE